MNIVPFFPTDIYGHMVNYKNSQDEEDCLICMGRLSYSLVQESA